jgi:hypothetical protein
MADLDVSEPAELVDPEAIAHIIFNENRSLTGSQLDDANAAVGHVVLNLLAHGEAIGDCTVTAPMGLPDDLSDYERDVSWNRRERVPHGRLTKAAGELIRPAVRLNSTTVQ